MRIAKIFAVLVLLAACSTAPATQQSTTIIVESPQPNTQLALGDSVTVSARVQGDAGRELRLSGDGTVLAKINLTGDVKSLTEQWTPATAGQHVISIEAYDTEGKIVARSPFVVIQVIAPTAVPTVAPTTQPEPTSAPTAAAPAATSPAAASKATTPTVPLTVNVVLANLRAGPSITAAISGQARQGETLTGTTKTADGLWWQVISGTLPVYISAELVTPAIAPAAVATVATTATVAATSAPPAAALGTALVISTPLANLRGGPGVQYPIVGQLAQNVTATVLGKSADGAWYQIRNAAASAWVFGELVRIDRDVAQKLAVVAAPPVPTAAPTAVPAATSAIVPIVPITPTAAPAPAQATPTPAANAGLPPCDANNPWWGVKVHKDAGYTFCVPDQFAFVGGTDGDEIRMRWHIYGIESLEMRVDPDGMDCGLGRTGTRYGVPQKTDDFRLNRRAFPRGGYKIGLWATLPGGRVQDWGQLNFCGIG